jgi:hypothetical protein
MTSYPFANKWDGFDPWLPGLGHAMALAALAGLSLCLAFENGWLLVMLVAAAQAPFAFTWRLSADWRYTAFTYPFFLVAAGVLVVSVAGLLRPSRWRVPPTDPQRRRMVAGWLLAMAGVAVVAWTVMRVLPVLSFQERLAANQSAVIVAGSRDRAFFGEGWAARVETPTVTTRAASGPMAAIDLPLPRAADYRVTVRMDPAPPPAGDEPPRVVHVLFNGTLVRTVSLAWDPARVGRYDLVIRRDLVKARGNRLTFLTGQAWTGAAPDGDGGTGRFRLWYVLVGPPDDGAA